MISVEEARARILTDLRPTPAEIVALADAWNRVTADAVVARLTQPPADVSAMDGYALRAADGALDATLALIGAAPAGHPFDGTVGPGQTVRLFTGSIVPQGADAILLQEDATRDGDTVRVNEAVKAGRHIRRAGQDFARGDTVVPAGRRITARDVGLAAAANHPWLSVHRRPRIAILATGDEIAMPGEPIPPGGIVSSNSHALAALVRAARRPAHRAADRRRHARGGRRGRRRRGRRRHAGDHRRRLGRRPRPGHRGPAIPRHGGGLLADRHAPRKAAAVRPASALRRSSALPGNPVSALVCAILFLLPALSRMAGLPAAPPPDHHGPARPAGRRQ